MMTVDRWRSDYLYVSHRLVRQIVQQDEATRTRWKLPLAIPTPWGLYSIQKESPDRENEFELCLRATQAVTDSTSSIKQGWGYYLREELDLTMGYVKVHRGWEHGINVDIATMTAEIQDPDVGRLLVALFGSAANYSCRRPTNDGLEGIPSDVDGLYGILERTREPGDKLIDSYYLDRDIGHTPEGRADTAVRLLNDRFKGFRSGRFAVLIQKFCTANEVGPYNQVILGAPVWVATIESQSPKARRGKHS